MVSMEAELKKREKSLRDLKKKLKSYQAKNQRSNRISTDVRKPQVYWKLKKICSPKKNPISKKLLQPRETIINTQNNRILALTEALNSYTNAKSHQVTVHGSTSSSRAILALTQENEEYRKRLINHDTIVATHVLQSKTI